MNKIEISEKFNPLFEIPPEVDLFILTGGRYSQKSFAASLASVNACSKYNHRVLYSRYTSASLKDSIYSEVIEKIDMLNYSDYFTPSINRIDSSFNNSKIVFKGLKAGSGQQTANLKGLKDFSYWVLDEAEELIDEAIFDKILLSIRGNSKGSKYKNIKVLILNPTTKEHFIYKKYFESKGVDGGWNGIKDNVCYIHTTYKDCIQFVPPEIQAYFEDMRIRNPKKYNHVVLGGWLDKAEGVVFNNWQVGKFDESIKSVFGQDFGFSIDPTTLVETAIDKDLKKIYVRLHYYKPKLTTTEIYNLNTRYAGNNLIIGDSAEPRLIHEVKNKGCNIQAVKKGKDSIITGISMLQDYDLIIDENSTDLIKELNNYVWHDKKSQTPVDDFNHAIDAMRYAVYFQLKNPHANQYHVY